MNAVLVQLDDLDIEQANQYLATALSEPQKRWAVCELEVYAVITCIQKLQFIVQTTCKYHCVVCSQNI